MNIGSHFANEDLYTEFKKFTLSQQYSIVNDNLSELENFYETGIFTDKIKGIILNIINIYIDNYIPKYTSCFFNMNASLMRENSICNFYIGIDDDGIASGIPFKINSTQELNDLTAKINKIIKNVIMSKITNNIISHDEILKCIKPKIIILNKTIDMLYSDKATAKQMELKFLERDLEELDNKKTDLKILLHEMNKIMYNIGIKKLKEYPEIANDIFKNIINSKKFPIIYNKRNNSHILFLKKMMDDFYHNSTTGETNYLRNYGDVIKKYNNIEDYIANNELQPALITLIHEKIKNIAERIKGKYWHYFVESIDNAKKEVRNFNTSYTSLLSNYNLLLYSIDTHLHTLKKDNNFIVINIEFDVNKYHKNRQKIPSNIVPPISYLDDTGELVTVMRSLKQSGNIYDPECRKIAI